MSARKFYIYKITNLVNNKVYIGKTYNPKKRWKDHIKTSQLSNSPKSSVIHRAMAKYGIDNFSYEVLVEFDDEAKSFEAEKYYIKLFDSIKFGYNLTEGGEGSSGYVASLETKKKQSEFHSKRVRRKLTNDEKTIIKEKRKKQKMVRHSLAIKNKVLEIYRENNHTKQQIADLLGLSYSGVVSIIRNGVGKEKFEPYKISNETRNKLRQSSLGRIITEDAKNKLSKLHTGKKQGPHSLEHRAKISSRLKGQNKCIKVTDQMRLNSGKTSERRGLLNDEQKQEIIDLYATGNFTKAQLAEKFKVPHKTIMYVTSKLAKRGILTEAEKTKHRSDAHKGKKLSNEHKRKISLGHIGKKHSNDTLIKLSLAKTGEKNGMYNRPQSTEAKSKMSNFQKTRPRREMTEQEKATISSKLKGRKHTLINEHVKQKVLAEWASGLYTKREIANRNETSYNAVVGIIRARATINNA